MSISSQFRSFLLSWKNSAATLKHVQIFLLFFGYAVLQTCFLFILIFYAHPPFSKLLIPVIEKSFGEVALHYPNNYVVLPILFTWTNILLSGLVGIVVVGTGTQLFSMEFTNKPVSISSGFRSTFPRYSFLFVVWLVETFFVMLILVWGGNLLQTFLSGHSRVLTQTVTTLAAILLDAMFAYTTALIVLDKRGIFSSVGISFSLFLKFPLISFLFIAVPNLIKMPLELLFNETQFLIVKFNPEVVGIIIGLSIFVSIFANYFLVGTVTRFFLLAKEKKLYA